MAGRDTVYYIKGMWAVNGSCTLQLFELDRGKANELLLIQKELDKGLKKLQRNFSTRSSELEKKTISAFQSISKKFWDDFYDAMSPMYIAEPVCKECEFEAGQIIEKDHVRIMQVVKPRLLKLQ